MFDVFQNIWWLIQATLLGYLCTRKIFTSGTDRLLFAPVTGFACVLLVGNSLWMWSLSTYLMSYVFVVALVCGAIFLCKDLPKSDFGAPSWMACGALIIILLGSFIPFEEKLFQAYPLDRFFYLGASILFEKENISYFADAITRISYNGDKRAYFLHPLLPIALNEIKARPASEMAFIVFSWATPRDLYRLANAWEVFFRVLQFSALFALFCKGLGKRYLMSGFLALSVALGYWLQYAKDFNAWGSATALTVAIATVAVILAILEADKVDGRSRLLVYLFAVTCVVTYPELGVPFAGGLFVLVCSNRLLRSGFLLQRQSWLELIALPIVILAAHPYIIAFMQRQYGLAPFMVGGEEFTARGLFRIFSTYAQRTEFVRSIVANPWHVITDPFSVSNLLIGSTGFSYLAYPGATRALVIGLVVAAVMLAVHAAKISPKQKIWIWVGLFFFCLVITALPRNHHLDLSPNFAAFSALLIGAALLALIVKSAMHTNRPKLRILLVLYGFYVCFFVGFLVWGKIGGAYRSLPFWGVFGTISLLILLAASKNKSFQVLAVCMACGHLAFAGSIFYVTNKSGMESYPTFYANATGVRHFEIPNARALYDFDYLDIVPDLKLCHTVFVDMNYRFQAANLAMFLENNNIRYALSIPYRNASPLAGGAFFPGFKRDEVNADCVVEEEKRNGRISYKFVQAHKY